MAFEAFGGERGDLGERLARDQLRRELGRDRDRHLDGFGFEPTFDRRAGPARELLERVADPLQRGGGAARRFRRRFGTRRVA